MIHTQLKGIELQFQTDESVFSPTAVDIGTMAMLSVVEFQPGDKVLDLGCGYGVVGILAAKSIGADHVVMCDISENAILCARKNAELNGVAGVPVLGSNGFEQIEDRDFSLILSNPPYHTDFSVAKGFIEEGFKHLVLGGRMVMVTKRLDWYKNKLIAVFGGVKVIEKDGYYIFIAEKRKLKRQEKEKKPQHLSKKLERKKQARTKTTG